MVREVGPEAVQSKLESDEDVAVVDIRSRDEFAQGHVPGAINVPLPELPRRVDEREWDAEEIVCVCPIGQSSIQAARLLGSYEAIDADAVASMEGGYRAWDGDLTVDGDAADGGRGPTDGSEHLEGGDPSRDDEGPEAPF
jgi:rhodanese-related sulfurtransferase